MTKEPFILGLCTRVVKAGTLLAWSILVDALGQMVDAIDSPYGWAVGLMIPSGYTT